MKIIPQYMLESRVLIDVGLKTIEHIPKYSTTTTTTVRCSTSGA